MLGFGTKKPPQLDRFPTEHWSVAKAEIDGAPVVLRINTGARKYAGDPDLPCRLGVTVAFNHPNEHGFCTADEGAQLSQLEDRLAAELQKGQVGFPVLAVTCGGKREFIFYVRNPSQASAAVDAVCKETTSHKLSFGLEEDRDWAYYQQFS